jgi:hypothetical protein
MSTMVGPKVLQMIANAGSIISNKYAVQAELSLKLAKQVQPNSFTPMTVPAGCTHINLFVIVISFLQKWLRKNCFQMFSSLPTLFLWH